VIPRDRASPLNKDFYANLKAQAWWQLRLRFERTWRAVREGVDYRPEDLISIPRDLPNRLQLMKELSQATASQSAGTLKMIVDKAPDGARSPNCADAVVMAYWPQSVSNYNLMALAS
jgi:phage terminase large subunit